jgi:hypothetical protein
VLRLPDLPPLCNEEVLALLDRRIGGVGQVEADLRAAHPLEEPADCAIPDRALELLDGAGRQSSLR